jgi:hypothetical protein
MPTDVLETVRENFVSIDKAAEEFLVKLTLKGIRADIILAAEMAGLMLLRSSGVDLQKLRPGAELKGAVSQEVAERVTRFVLDWSKSNRLSDGVQMVLIPGGYKKYRRDVGKFENSLYAACRANAIKREHLPFVAATAALKLVVAGVKLHAFGAEEGLGLVIFHVEVGSKTVPYPLDV